MEREGAGEGGGGFHWCKSCLVGYLFLSTVAHKRCSIIHPKTLYNVIIDTILFWPAKVIGSINSQTLGGIITWGGGEGGDMAL